MFIKVAVDGRVTLEDQANFRAFKLVVEAGPADLAATRRALKDVADLPDAATAWVFEAALRRAPEVARDETWQQGLAAMIEKARPHGWIDDARKAIKAHVEWTRPA